MKMLYIDGHSGWLPRRWNVTGDWGWWSGWTYSRVGLLHCCAAATTSEERKLFSGFIETGGGGKERKRESMRDNHKEGKVGEIWER